MGHVPIVASSLARSARHPDIRWVYTHLNNTNPVVDPSTPEYAAVLAGGAELPGDGTEFKL